MQSGERMRMLFQYFRSGHEDDDVGKREGVKHLVGEREGVIKLQWLHETELAWNIRKRYEQIREANDYDQLVWVMYLFKREPCIAATYSFIPVEGNDAMAIIN